MTMDIDNLQPGPELDALIAEKVMGWMVCKAHAQGLNHGALIECSENRCGDLLPEKGGDRLWTRSEEQWNPSARIEAAWQVVEKLRALRFDILLDMTWGRSGILAFACADGIIRDVKVGCGGVPLAICRAAWKARGER